MEKVVHKSSNSKVYRNDSSLAGVDVYVIFDSAMIRMIGIILILAVEGFSHFQRTERAKDRLDSDVSMVYLDSLPRAALVVSTNVQPLRAPA